MHLNAVIYGLGSHEAAWRMPESDPHALTRLSFWTDLARRAEAGGFDGLFMGDVLALQAGADKHLSEAMDPIVMMSALAAVTTRIRLIATASTTFDHPFHLARRFACLDHISNGRAGWNIVTSSNRLEAQNFGLESMPEHGERYKRAADVVDAAIALWASWEEDAKIADQTTGQYLDPIKVRRVNYRGPFVGTAGPLNVPRPPSGRPLLAQAGSSEHGRAFAASRADIVFTVQSDMAEARDFYSEIKEQAAYAGRDPDSILVLPGIVPVIASTREAAEARLLELNSFASPDHLIAKGSEFLGVDLRQVDLDLPLEASLTMGAGNQASKSRVAALVGIARRDKLTVRELLGRLASGRGHLLVVGTGQDIAGTMREWFESGAADGFNVMCPVLPGDLTLFVEHVMPRLAAAGFVPAREVSADDKSFGNQPP